MKYHTVQPFNHFTFSTSNYMRSKKFESHRFEIAPTAQRLLLLQLLYTFHLWSIPPPILSQ
jgi:hypothetical protein